MELSAVIHEIDQANAALHHTNPDPLWTPDNGCHAVLFTAGSRLGETGQVAAATDYFQRLHEAAHQRLGPDHPGHPVHPPQPRLLAGAGRRWLTQTGCSD